MVIRRRHPRVRDLAPALPGLSMKKSAAFGPERGAFVTEHVTFSFGENWNRYLDHLPPIALERMAAYVAGWLGSDLSGRDLVDIGSGQGLTSLVAHQAGARVTSIDADPASVAATGRLRSRAGDPDSWRVFEGSIPDA